jgi:hypothetical protein
MIGKLLFAWLLALGASACAGPQLGEVPGSQGLVEYTSVVHPVSGAELPRIRLPERPEVEARVNQTLDAHAADLRCDSTGEDIEWNTYARVTYAANDVFSVRIVSNLYCGGAHPTIDEDSSLTFDLRTGEAIPFRSLFADYERDAGAITGAYLVHLTDEEREGCEDFLTAAELEGHYFSYTISPSGVRMRTAFPFVIKVCNRTAVVPFAALAPHGRAGGVLERLAGLPLPADVVAEIDRLIADCEPEFGASEDSVSPEARRASLDAVEVCELTGDGWPDYLIDDSDVACAAGVSFRHGNGGTGIVVMVSDRDGVRVAFNAPAFGARVEEAPGAPRLWLLLGGSNCGQDTKGVPRSAMIACARPLDWNAGTGSFALAAMSETRFEGAP